MDTFITWFVGLFSNWGVVWKNFDYLLFGAYPQGQLRRAIARRPVVGGEQARVAALRVQMRGQQIADTAQVHLLLFNDRLMPAQLEHVAGGNDGQSDDRQEDDHQLQAQGRWPEPEKLTQQGAHVGGYGPQPGRRNE